jgi:hypothetical protein
MGIVGNNPLHVPYFSFLRKIIPVPQTKFLFKAFYSAKNNDFYHPLKVEEPQHPNCLIIFIFEGISRLRQSHVATQRVSAHFAFAP